MRGMAIHISIDLCLYRLQGEPSLAGQDQLRSIRACARLELLDATAEAVGSVEIALRVDRHLVQLPEGAREGAVAAPRVEELAVPIVLEDPRARAVGDPP